ncbi:MAG: hypothetical protein K2O45_08395 [Oscillospiraceae bacterium]|nr:hypothetical protein [Oscillospiraceae bacterium]
MFGKLLKYDFRSMFKQFAFIWPAALALALVNRFTLSGLDSTSTVGETTAGIAMLVYVAILIAMFIIAVIFVIQRFYKGLLGDEGYLMHTLPVKPWQLVGSKLLCAVTTTVINVLIAILSIFLIIPWGMEEFRDIFRGLQYVFSHWNIQATHGIIFVAELILFSLVSFATGYLQLYLAMSIGHLFNKNRVAFSVIAFIALNAIMGTLGNIILPPLGDLMEPAFRGMSGITAAHTGIWLLIAGSLILSAVFFAGTEFILRRKLNLE